MEASLWVTIWIRAAGRSIPEKDGTAVLQGIVLGLSHQVSSGTLVWGFEVSLAGLRI